MMDFFTFDGVSSADYFVGINGNKTFGSPNRRKEFVSVDGRSGDLVIDRGGYENTILTYECHIVKDFQRNIEGFRNFLLSKVGYKRLEDTAHPDEYRMAAVSGGLDIEAMGYAKAAVFDVSFNCKPQRWLKSGENEVIPGEILYNPTLYPSKPKIRLYGTGTLTIGEYEMTVDALYPNEYIDIDCDLMNASYGAVNFNNYISGQFPMLEPGDNEISWTGDSLTIIPRWWTI